MGFGFRVVATTVVVKAVKIEILTNGCEYIVNGCCHHVGRGESRGYYRHHLKVVNAVICKVSLISVENSGQSEVEQCLMVSFQGL